MHAIGVIEGFYGKAWSWQERQSMLAFLAKHQFLGYIYAPKSDHYLRQHWQQCWPTATFEQLTQLRYSAQNLSLNFGIGLSPLGLYQAWRDGDGREALTKRLAQISALQPNTLALLFDDMQGNLPALAQTQVDIAHFVKDKLPDTHLVLCPSYYSFDAILEQLFGQMPANYLQDIGKKLDPSIDIFWTGDKVISYEYSAKSLNTISAIFQRKPVIWDNSIVNDGRKTSPYINIRAMYEPASVINEVNAIMINPMNAPALSQLVISTLLKQGSSEARLKQAIKEIAPEAVDAFTLTAHLLAKSLEQLTINEKQTIQQQFTASASEVSNDIRRWLEGEFQFDPACLT